MTQFYKKVWFPYICPFLLCFVLSETTKYLPEWHFHLLIAKVFGGGALLWGWRKHFTAELAEKNTKLQIYIATTFGIIGFSVWVITLRYQLIQFPHESIPAEWPYFIQLSVNSIILIGAILVMPVISELFWRSFMLRYLIEQNFKAVPLGQFQLFSFSLVVILATITSEYVVAVATVCALQNILIIWQKNLRCCIISAVVTATLLSLYLLSNSYQLM